ncbi:hypothetical protein TA3x_004944 [Tundrisphaera sp. TA3]|uniref:hypothetical protein n=1 Tax=Tundrisphaera sp. TA3 TaxID=3435775 RepID=UPI003EBEBCC7
MIHPKSSAILQAGLRAVELSTPFKAEADAALAHFRAARGEVESLVRRGDLTTKVAREQAEAAAHKLRTELTARAEGYSPVPVAFLDRLVEAIQQRQKARETMSLEGLQRETNRLLRRSLVEGQIQSRAPEFEARAFSRPVAGGAPAPTLDGLLGLHRSAEQAGDEAALEWSRRQLEAFRSRVMEEADLRRIDLACDLPDRVNPRLVGVYLAAMADRPSDELEVFVDRAIGEGDASACVAAFTLARQDPSRADARWARRVLAGLPEFPDTALSTLRAMEAEARQREAEAARAHADLAIAMAESEARLEGLAAPTAADLERAERLASMAMARPAPVADGGNPPDDDVTFIG